MRYDPIRAQLAISSDELDRLLELVAPVARDTPAPPADFPTESEPDRALGDGADRALGDGADGALGDGADGALVGFPDERARWSAAGMVNDGRFHPTVVGIVGVLSRPTRSVVIERFCGNVVMPLFVAWDANGRATLTDGIPGGDLSIEATSFDLLPSLLLQAVHLHRGSGAPDRRGPIVTTAGAVERVFDPGRGSEHPVDDCLARLLTDLRFAWRASGSWRGQETDTSVTVVCTGTRGPWTVSHRAQNSESPSPETEVVLTPTTVPEVAAMLGDVVTGRTTVPDAA